jgi:hypothetical protein
VAIALGAIGATIPACASIVGITDIVGADAGDGGEGGTEASADGQGGSGDAAVDGAADGAVDGGSGSKDGSSTDASPRRIASIEKVDVLFDVDNSASMGDKQNYLTAAIPDLINRLLNPNCVDASNVSHGPSSNGVCASGWSLEFPPVHDLHLGVVTSSLGARGGNACNPIAMALPPFQNVLAHNDDQGHLVNRTLTYAVGGGSVTEGIVADAPLPDPYLYWLPQSQNAGVEAGPGNVLSPPSVQSTQLVQDFASMVQGVGVFGCGLESQIESWYRFLVQPDPYATIDVDAGTSVNPVASWTGVDQTLLQERADFLRPDSLVLIVDLSDEDDGEVDVRSFGGQGYNWMSSNFDPPNGTAACSTDAGSSACQSCAQGSNGSTDSQCKSQPVYTAINDWGYDLNLRHVHMKAKYGIDVQFPIGRYVTGLTSTTVPDRAGEYPSGSSSYVGTKDCTNPLFATGLPTSGTSTSALCNLTPGPRTPDMVFYAHIGGVPSSLLHFKHGDPASSTLTSADWVKILGNDPQNYDYSGIDPHMIESYQPRSGIAPPGSANGADAINGHDWITDQPVGVMGGHVLQVDREYACIFPLSDSNGNPTARDCSVPQNANFCDCPHMAGTVNAMQLPPVCDQTTITKQIAAKAYPTIRELLVAKLLGTQGIVGSICPVDTSDNATHDDPLYGYRPAVEMMIDRMKTALVPLGSDAGP